MKDEYVEQWMKKGDNDLTHNLRFLIEKCVKYSEEFESLRKDAIILTSYSVESRYPDDLIDYSVEEAKEAIEMAKKIKQFIINKMEDKKCSN